MPRTASAKQDKFAKVRPLIAVLTPKFLNLYNPSQNLSPDECMLKFKKTHQTGYESLLPERVKNRLHMRVETVYRS